MKVTHNSKKDEAPEVRAQKRSMAKVNNYKKVFSSPEGRSVLLDLMKTHYMFDDLFAPDAMELSARVGERAVVVRILKMMKLDLDQMRERIEANEREME